MAKPPSDWRPERISINLTAEEADDLARLLPADHPVRARIQNATHPSHVYVCGSCGSPDVSGTAWVDANGDYVQGIDPPLDRLYCEACDDDDCRPDFVALHQEEPQP